MRAAACYSALPAVAPSKPGCSGRGKRNEAVVARAMRVPSSLSSSAVAAVGRLDLDLLRPSLPPSSFASCPSSRFRPRVPGTRRRRQFYPLSSQQPRAAGPGDEGEENAPSTSSSSSPSDVETENPKKKESSKKATALGDLIALISPARKREAGGPPPPTFSKRMRAIKGSLRVVLAQAWRKTLTLPGFSQVVAALSALDTLTRPARDALRDAWMDLNERFEMFRVEETKQRWAWESRSKEQGRVWKHFCDHLLWFVFATPYLILCPSHLFFSCFLPLFVGFVAFDNPLLNGVTVAWVAAMVAGKLRRGLLSGLVGLPPGFSGL